MNIYVYRDILILTTLLTSTSALLAEKTDTHIPLRQGYEGQAYPGKLEFFKNRKPSIELSDLIAIIQATNLLDDAAQALEATKKRVMEKINPDLALSWLATLDQTYSDHVASHITFEFEHEQKTVSDLFALYRALEQEIIKLHMEMQKLDDEHKSDHLDAMLAIIQRGKAIEDFLAAALAPQTPIARTWIEMSKSNYAITSPTGLPTSLPKELRWTGQSAPGKASDYAKASLDTSLGTFAAVTKNMASYIIYKASPAVTADFNARIAALRATKMFKDAQLSYSSTQAWLQARLTGGDITPGEFAAWTAILNTTYNDQITLRLPQLQISQMYGKAKGALKTLVPLMTA